MNRRDFISIPLALALRSVKLSAQSAPDFHLQPTSPAIGVGIVIASVVRDYDLNFRGNPSCMGAYEYVPTTIPGPTDLTITGTK